MYFLWAHMHYCLLVLLVEGPGPFFVKAFALRGTLYTLISKADEAIKDLTQVIDADDMNVSVKVHSNYRNISASSWGLTLMLPWQPIFDRQFFSEVTGKSL